MDVNDIQVFLASRPLSESVTFDLPSGHRGRLSDN